LPLINGAKSVTVSQSQVPVPTAPTDITEEGGWNIADVSSIPVIPTSTRQRQASEEFEKASSETNSIGLNGSEAIRTEILGSLQTNEESRYLVLDRSCSIDADDMLVDEKFVIDESLIFPLQPCLESTSRSYQIGGTSEPESEPGPLDNTIDHGYY
jgi:hypothetical protein